MFSSIRGMMHQADLEKDLKKAIKNATSPVAVKDAIDTFARGSTGGRDAALSKVRAILAKHGSVIGTQGLALYEAPAQTPHPQAPARQAEATAQQARAQRAPAVVAEASTSAAAFEAPLTIRSAPTMRSVQSGKTSAFAQNLLDGGLDADLVEALMSEGLKRIESALKGEDIIFVPDRSGSTSGALQRRIERAILALHAASLGLDPDGSTVYPITRHKRAPFDKIDSIKAMRDVLKSIPVGGGTPIGRTAKQVVEDIFAEWEANKALPKEEQKSIKKKTIIALVDGASSEDYDLFVGHAAADGVYINGEPAPENALVAGRITRDNRVVNGVPTVDSDLQKTTLVSAATLDPELRHFAQAEAREWARHNGVSPAEIAGKVVAQERDEGVPVAKNTLLGQVLVRVPVSLEEVIVNAVKRAKESGMPQTQFGFLLWLEGDEPGAHDWFTHLDNNLKERCGRDVVAYVKAPAELTVPALIKALCGARNQREGNKQI